MESKKSKNKQVERYAGLLFDAGLVLALSLTLMAFKLNVKPYEFDLPEPAEIEEPIDLVVPATKEAEPEPQTPKKMTKEPLVVPPVFILKPVDGEPLDTNRLQVMDDNMFMDNIDDPMANEFAPEPTKNPWELSKMPEFPGGFSALADFLRSNLQFPRYENELGISGKVTLKIMVNKKGEVTNIEVFQGSTENFNKEALRVANKIPNWEPGIFNGRKVSCWFYLPISFKSTNGF
ncbi:TonB family protein [bacterium]|nr:TonB family protein [bacterium]